MSEAVRTGQGPEKIAELMEVLPFSSGLTDFRHQGARLPPPGAADADGTANGSPPGGRGTSHE